MNKDNISKDTYEQYVDATVALFMEYYCLASFPESIRTEMDAAAHDTLDFPEDLDSRCRLLIKKAGARQRMKQYVKSITRGLRYAAVFSATVLSLFSFLFITVEAFRVPVINYYIEQSDGHWEISVQGNPSLETPNDTIDVSNPLKGLIPDEYQLVVLEGESLNKLTAIYEDPTGNEIYFSCKPGSNLITIDSEDAEESERCQIISCDAIIVIKDGVLLTWIHKESSTVFSIISNKLTKAEALDIAEQFIDKIS